MNKQTRRDFLRNSVLASSALFVPAFLKGFDGGAHTLQREDGKILVIIQWTGGNDGLNTFIPYRNDIYYRSRPTLSIHPDDVLKANDEMGFNPVMEGMKELYDEGLVCAINSVGYPNPDRSHFRSMDIWHTGSGAEEYLSTGWLGRYLDSHENENPYRAIEADETLSLALRGVNQRGFAVNNIKQLKKTTQNQFLNALAHHHNHDHDENVAYLYRTMVNTISSADYLYEQSKKYTSKVAYPQSAFAQQLKQISELIISDTGTRIYYVSMTGFDTHVFQKRPQEQLLKQYSDGMRAFMKDLRGNNRLDDVLVMTFSEFGRRVKQNASKGTDHGTANNLYLIGGGLKQPGVYNNAPNLSKLDNGDLIYEMDFRRVYATILKKWLQVNDEDILGKQFDLLKML